MIHVVAIITTKAGMRPDVLEMFHRNIPLVLAETGCIEYGPAVDAKGGTGATFGPDTFVVIEKWDSLEALAAHAKAPHMTAYAEMTRALIANRAVHILEPA
ncbi:MAG TPA: putative quinol monooxygenase [Telmatospirillum sp.]|nr:putative quinol monooxygenase [Telmatospirillum sp.]